MHSLYANTLNEVEKIWRRGRTRFFLALAVALPILSAVFIGYVQTGTGVFEAIGATLPMQMLNLYTFALMPVFLFMTAADTFSGEEEAGMLKLVLVRPITRTRAFTSKVAALGFYIAVQLAGLWLVSAAGGWFVSGNELAGELPDAVMAYAAAFIPMLAVALIAAFIAQIFRSSSGALVLMLLIYAASKIVPIFFPGFAGWSAFSYTNWHILWIGTGASFGRLSGTFALLLSYCIMAYTAGWTLFLRKNL